MCYKKQCPVAAKKAKKDQAFIFTAAVIKRKSADDARKRRVAVGASALEAS